MQENKVVCEETRTIVSLFNQKMASVLPKFVVVSFQSLWEQFENILPKWWPKQKVEFLSRFLAEAAKSFQNMISEGSSAQENRVAKAFLEFANEALSKNMFSLTDLLGALVKHVHLNLQLSNFFSFGEKVTENVLKALDARCLSMQCANIFMRSLVLLLKSADLGDVTVPPQVFQENISSLLGGITNISNFPEHADYKDISLLDSKGMKLYARIVEYCLKSINVILEWFSVEETVENKVPKSLVKYIIKDCVPDVMTLLLAHLGKHEWTTIETRKEAQRACELLCKITSCQDLESLFIGEGTKILPNDSADLMFHKGVLGLVLSKISGKFVSDGWKRNPTLKHCLLRAIMNVKYPHLGQHIKVVVPLLLEMIEDYKSENQVLGVGCMEYLIENVNASDLNLHSHAAVIYQVLFKLLFGAKHVTLQVLLPCLLKILFVLEPFPGRIDIGTVSKWNETIQKVISNFEYESDVNARRLLLRNIKSFVAAVGINLAKYMKSVLRVLEATLEFHDGQEEAARKLALDVLETVVVSCWPLVPHHVGTILKMILKLIVDTNASESLISTEVHNQLNSKSMGIILLLDECCKAGVVTEYLKCAMDSEVSGNFSAVKTFIKQVMERVVEGHKAMM